MIRVGVIGATGRMGQQACRAIVADPDLALVGAIGGTRSGEPLDPLAGTSDTGLTVGGSVDDLVASGAEVVVDLSVADATRANLPRVAAAAMHAVVGTSGLTGDDLDSLRDAFTRSNCLVSPNFAIGAVLLMRFAEMAAPLFETAEVIEMHHDAKIDAPSGTATITAERMAAASEDWADDPTEAETVEGVRGGSGPGGIRIHSVRLRGLVAHQEVLLGTTGQTLSIRHDTTDRSCFMPGIVAAVKKIGELPGLTVGLEPVFGL